MWVKDGGGMEESKGKSGCAPPETKSWLCHCAQYNTGSNWIKGKGDHTPVERRLGAHLPHIGLWTRRWIDRWVCDAWPMRRQTYGYLPSRRASLSLGRYRIILLGDRATWVWTTCPELLPSNAPAGSQTCNVSITSPTPYHYTTEPPNSLSWRYIILLLTTMLLLLLLLLYNIYCSIRALVQLLYPLLLTI